MLVLSRQHGKSIMIGDDIEITIVDIRGDVVRVGITAPESIPVHRREVYDAIKRENESATRMSVEDMARAKEQMNDKSGTLEQLGPDYEPSHEDHERKIRNSRWLNQT